MHVVVNFNFFTQEWLLKALFELPADKLEFELLFYVEVLEAEGKDLIGQFQKTRGHFFEPVD